MLEFSGAEVYNIQLQSAQAAGLSLSPKARKNASHPPNCLQSPRVHSLPPPQLLKGWSHHVTGPC